MEWNNYFVEVNMGYFSFSTPHLVDYFLELHPRNSVFSILIFCSYPLFYTTVEKMVVRQS